MIGEPSGGKQTVVQAEATLSRREAVFRTLGRSYPVLLLAIVVGAVLLRTLGVWSEVFSPDGVVLAEVDPWYHLRLCVHLADNFPEILTHDPYALHPGGGGVPVAPLLDYVVVLTAWALGGGRPSEHLLATVAAVVPVVAAGLLVWVVGLLGREVMSRRAGLLAALLVALMPGPLLRCTMLGFADHHALETLFAALVLLGLVRALRVDASESAQPEMRRSTRSAWWAGVALAAYLLTWVGGVVLVLILMGWAVVQWPIEQRRGRPTARLAAVTTRLVFPAALLVLPQVGARGWAREQLAALVGLELLALALTAVMPGRTASRGLGSRRTRLTAGVAAGVLAGGVLWGTPIWPTVRLWFSWYLFGAQRSLVEEASPLFFANGVLSLAPMWETFGVTLVAALAGWAWLAVETVRRPAPARVLMLVWSAGMVLLTVQQRRFAYYASVNVALLAAFAAEAWWTHWERGPLPDGRGSVVRLALSVVLLAGPSAVLAVRWAGQATGPAPDWRAALAWMRARTPEPYGDAAYFTADYVHERGPAVADYGVMASWDRGYWITQLGRRVPCSNPTQAGAGVTASYFMAESEAAGAAILERLGARYVIMDCTIPVWQDQRGAFSVGKFQTLARWAGEDPRRFLERVAGPDVDSPPMLLFHPDYYRSMAVRLYAFGGQAYEPQGPVWAAVVARHDGAAVLSDLRRFSDYAAALAFVEAHAEAPWQLVGLNPSESCVPLAALEWHRCVYESPTAVAERDGDTLGYVQIFEYTPSVEAPAVGR